MDFIQLFNQTKAAFADHQHHCNRYHYPDHLKRDAILLLKQYSLPALSEALRISTKTLRVWQKENDGLNDQTPTAASFVSVTLPPSETAPAPMIPPLQVLTLKLPHQLELMVPAKSMKESVRWICCFVEEFAKCSI